jgi:hypothetical protein
MRGRATESNFNTWKNNSVNFCVWSSSFVTPQTLVTSFRFDIHSFGLTTLAFFFEETGWPGTWLFPICGPMMKWTLKIWNSAKGATDLPVLGSGTNPVEVKSIYGGSNWPSYFSFQLWNTAKRSIVNSLDRDFLSRRRASCQLSLKC